MARRWALDVPLHLAQDDYSKDACDLRFTLYTSAFHRTGGKGFRHPKGTGSKRKRPRKGWGTYDAALARPYTLQMMARHAQG
jgi:hypothetical protein